MGAGCREGLALLCACIQTCLHIAQLAPSPLGVLKLHDLQQAPLHLQNIARAHLHGIVDEFGRSSSALMAAGQPRSTLLLQQSLCHTSLACFFSPLTCSNCSVAAAGAQQVSNCCQPDRRSWLTLETDLALNMGSVSWLSV